LDAAYRQIVEHLDDEIERLRHGGTPADWESLYGSLMSETRTTISYLAAVTMELR
jgi:hypothetical protein